MRRAERVIGFYWHSNFSAGMWMERSHIPAVREPVRSGAVGIMQVKPSTAAGPPISIRNVHHVENNIHAGAKYIRFIIDQYYGDEAMSELDKMLFAFASYTIHFAVADGGQGSKGAVPGGTPPTRYDASGKVRCSADKPTLDQWCDFRVVRDLPSKAADIWIANIAFKSEERYRFFHIGRNRATHGSPTARQPGAALPRAPLSRTKAFPWGTPHPIS